MLLALSGGAFAVHAAFLPPIETKILPSDPASGARFGWSVDVDGDRAVVGAIDSGGTGCGFVFERSALLWREVQHLAVPTTQCQVAISGDVVAVGNGSNAVSVFEWNPAAGADGEWEEVDTLQASDGVSGDQFSWAVAIQGHTIAVGAYGHDEARGAVYLYERTLGEDDEVVWEEVDKIADPEALPDDEFGTSLDFDGNLLVVGAPGATADAVGGPVNAGAAYLYRRSGMEWTLEEKVFSPGASRPMDYGMSVALDRGVLAVGAPRDRAPIFPPLTPNETGTVYYYDISAEVINSTQVRVWPSDHQATNHPRQFGFSIALDGRALVIGAFLGGPEVQNAGAVYLFDLDEFLLNETLKLTASDASEDDQFGMAVAVDRPFMITGAIFADIEGRADAGAAYLYNVPEPAAGAASLAALAAIGQLARRRRSSRGSSRAAETTAMPKG